MIGWVVLAIATVLLIAWLLWSPTRRGYAGVAVQSRWFWWPVTLLLLLVIGIGVYKQYGEHLPTTMATAPPATDTVFTVVAWPGLPAEGVMPPGWRMEWSEPDHINNFSSHVTWRGSDKVRVFTVKPGFDRAEIKLRIYRCSDRRPC
ncbi:MAG: hypothetical protein Q8P21_02690 [bacterium]|nr:hypothetical protein [bacterium]